MKFLTLFIFSLIGGLSLFAQTPSAENKAFREELYDIIRGKMGNCEYDSSDNSLNFNDCNYWLCINNDQAPFLIDFHMEGEQIDPKRTDISKVLEKCNRANVDVMGGKAYLAKTSDGLYYVNYTSQFYLTNPQDLVKFFNKQIQILNDLKSAYNK